MNCSNRCFEIGGPWISEDPNCPIHGIAAQRRQKDADEEKTVFLERIESLEKRIRYLESRIEAQEKRLKALEVKVL